MLALFNRRKEDLMKILVTGGAGFLGRYVVQELRGIGHNNIKIVRSSETDLRLREKVDNLLMDYGPDIVIHLAATVGGIGANMNSPGRFFYDNMVMGLNLIESSRIYGVGKFIQLGTVCSYPKYCEVPFKEQDIWNGYPEETNAPYGIAKKALFVMLDAYRKEYNFNSTILVPCNLYGPYDNFNPDTSHVIPALIKKFVQAKNNKDSNVSCWGTGRATREFLYVKDAAEAIVKSININTDCSPINLGGGEEISIYNLANQIASSVGYDGNISWDSSKPDGQPRRYLDVGRASQVLNWKASTSLEDGLKKTIAYYNNLIDND
jgi:GDP-L-fucose synthase